MGFRVGWAVAGYVVTIAGGSASGKSTLSQRLAERLRENTTVDLVSIDSFMRREDPTAPHFDFQFDGTSTFNFNHPESVDLPALLSTISGSSADVTILEGLMTLAIPELRALSSLTLFIDLDADVRAIRRMERDIRIGRGGGDPKYIAAYYLECARIGHRDFVETSKQYADVILRGDADLDRTCNLVAQLVLAKV
jgi:uridine kinase